MLLSSHQKTDDLLFAIIADEDTLVGFLLAGIGNSEKDNKNFLAVDSKTPRSQIEQTFRNFTSRADVGILLITQDIAELIRPTVDSYEQLVPIIVEIPSKGRPYDLSKDGVMQRASKLLGTN